MTRMEQIRARLAAIGTELDGMNAGQMDDAALTKIEALNKEFEALNRELSALQAKEDMQAKLTASAGRKTTPAAPAATPAAAATVTQPQNARYAGFEDLGSFLSAVKQHGLGNSMDTRLQALHQERIGEEGGFLVPEDLASEIQKVLTSEESLYSKTRQFTVSGNGLAMPIDETQPWNSGVIAYWTAEAAKIKESKGKIGMARLHLNKLAAMVTLTDELESDAVAMASYIKAMAPAAIMHKLNDSIINGTGAGMPTGLLNSDFVVTVQKESGQAADTVVAKNIIKMYSSLIATARRGAAWYINAAVEPELLTMKDDNGNFIYLAPGSQMNQTPYGMLLGLPVIPMLASLPALGDSGDIILANLSYYYTISKGGIKSASSIHMYFDREITAYRFSMRVDGRVPFTKPVKTEKGDFYQSAFVKLADRA